MVTANLTRAVSRQFRALFVSDAFSGVLLIAVAVAAMLVANSPLAGAYHHALHGEWFAPHPDILAEIERLEGQNG